MVSEGDVKKATVMTSSAAPDLGAVQAACPAPDGLTRLLRTAGKHG